MPSPKPYRLRSSRPKPRGINFVESLNAEQLAAVQHEKGYALILAGAGTGKTRTLTYRAARLVQEGVAPDRILLCTFTNKAAREMVDRLESLIGTEMGRMWAGTFHHIANKGLRRHGTHVGLPENYGILDREDAREVLSLCIADEGKALRQRRFPKAGLLQHLGSMATNCQKSLADTVRIHAPKFLDNVDDIERILQRFAEKKLRLAMLDYDDLLVFFHRLLQVPEHAETVSQQFLHVLVDEYQDTNRLQGEIVECCAQVHGNLTVVGDDAQSIYAFRGAHFKNIIDFPKRFPDAKVFKLETNYRSTPEILRLANLSIRNNVRQFPKSLRPVRNPGMVPALLPLHDIDQEAEFVAQRVLELSQEEEVPLEKIAVIYRAHAHSLQLQIELSRRNIPYRIHSGLRFFEQAHIKDILGYLRLVQNRGDAIAWRRVLKLWPGVGKRTSDKILQITDNIGAPGGAHSLRDPELLASMPATARPSLKSLGELVEKLSSDSDVAAKISAILDAHYRSFAEETFANAPARLEDLEQLADFAERYDDLETFLSELALVAGVAAEGVGPGEAPEEKMTLTTIHQAKGREWHTVFMINLAEGSFPQPMALRHESELEEERRLFYVALTRAQEQLYLCYPRFAENNRGPRRLLRLTRFLAELAPNPPYERWQIEEVPEDAQS